MALKYQLKYGKDETFWENLDKLQRILVCFSNLQTSEEQTKLSNQTIVVQSKTEEAIFCRQNNCESKSEERTRLLEKIDNVLKEYLSKNSTVATIQMPNRRLWKNTSFKVDSGIKMIDKPTLTTIGAQKNGSSKKLVRFLHTLTKIHKLIKSDTYRTKRELYYEDVPLFKKQSTLDDILDDIACLLKTPKIKLHVLTTSKGCIAGNLRYKEADGSYVDCSGSSQGILLPNDVGNISYVQSDARFILVVEKSAVFQMLLDSNITELLHPCIMMTGKGYPDVNTREMLRKLWDTLRIPILGLVDADPYGVEILSIYKYGSMAMSFDVENLAVPEIRWLGLLPSDIEKLQFPETATITMSDRDVKRAQSLLQRPYIQNNIQWRHQIQILLEKSEKAEIEGLSKIADNFLPESYLPNKIRYGGWI